MKSDMKKKLSKIAWFFILALMLVGAVNAVIVTFAADSSFGWMAILAVIPSLVYIYKKGKEKLFDN
jgi:membrane protein YdbS with pleckstrin-like domain